MEVAIFPVSFNTLLEIIVNCSCGVCVLVCGGWGGGGTVWPAIDVSQVEKLVNITSENCTSTWMFL